METTQEFNEFAKQYGAKSVKARSAVQNGKRVFIVEAIGYRKFSRQVHHDLTVALYAALEGVAR